jgi:hypothetical protein
LSAKLPGAQQWSCKVFSRSGVLNQLRDKDTINCLDSSPSCSLQFTAQIIGKPS